MISRGIGKSASRSVARSLSQFGSGGGGVSALIAAINNERASAGNSQLSASAQSVLAGIESHLKGVANQWSTDNGLSPIDVWDDIVFWTDFNSKANIGTGSNILAFVAPDSASTTSLATIKGSLIGSQAWDARSNFSTNDRYEFPLSSYELPHTWTCIWVGHKPKSSSNNPIYSWQKNYTGLVNYNPATDGDSWVMRRRTNANNNGVGEVNYFGESNDGMLYSSRPGQAINYANNGIVGQYTITSQQTDAYAFTSGDTSTGEVLIFSAFVRTDANRVVIPVDSDALHGQMILIKRTLSAAESRDLAEAILAASAQIDVDGASSFAIMAQEVAGDGSTHYYIATKNAGFIRVRVIEPDSPAAKPHRYALVMQATEPDLYSLYGDGFSTAVAANYHNVYNMTLVSVDFESSPWYCNHSSYVTRHHEAFIVDELVPWTEANYGTAGDNWVAVGFSKSGCGALQLIFRNQSVFTAAAAWDGPFDMENISDEPAIQAETLTAFGTEQNFDNYNLTALATDSTDFSTGDSRLWIGYATGTAPNAGAWRSNVLAYSSTLAGLGIVYNIQDVGAATHSWSTTWLDYAMAFLDTASD